MKPHNNSRLLSVVVLLASFLAVFFLTRSGGWTDYLSAVVLAALAASMLVLRFLSGSRSVARWWDWEAMTAKKGRRPLRLPSVRWKPGVFVDLTIQDLFFDAPHFGCDVEVAGPPADVVRRLRAVCAGARSLLEHGDGRFEASFDQPPKGSPLLADRGARVFVRVDELSAGRSRVRFVVFRGGFTLFQPVSQLAHTVADAAPDGTAVDWAVAVEGAHRGAAVLWSALCDVCSVGEEARSRVRSTALFVESVAATGEMLRQKPRRWVVVTSVVVVLLFLSFMLLVVFSP